MGFFKSLLDDAIDKSLSMADIDKTKARSALSSLSSVLKQQEPPAVPEVGETMSVMIAVNGQSYGPYERATLLQMINNGTLTRETYVFIQGMSGWKAASEVPQVAMLLDLNAPAPPAPPVPWQSAPQPPTAPAASAQATTYDNSLSPRLNSLINAAVADGEISDMERNVLIRNAQQEGVSMDEFVMVLEARLYEQQQALRARQQEAENKQKAAAAVNAAPIPVRPSRPEVRKCPACGEIIKEIGSKKCASCGYEFDNYSGASVSIVSSDSSGFSVPHGTSAIDQLAAQLYDENGFYRENLIESYPIPSNKADFIDLLIFCAAKSEDGWSEMQDECKFKVKQLIDRAYVSYKNDEDVMALVNKYSAIVNKKKLFGLF